MFSETLIKNVLQRRQRLQSSTYSGILWGTCGSHGDTCQMSTQRQPNNGVLAVGRRLLHVAVQCGLYNDAAADIGHYRPGCRPCQQLFTPRCAQTRFSPLNKQYEVRAEYFPSYDQGADSTRCALTERLAQLLGPGA